MRDGRRKTSKRLGAARRMRPLSAAQSARLTNAISEHSTGSFSVAEAEYRKLLADGVRLPQLYCNLAAICAQTARREEADILWRRALEIDPDSVEAQMNLADSHQLAGDIDKAGNIYRRIIAARGDFHIAQYLLANILKAQGKLDEAQVLYEQIIRRRPDYTQAHFSYSSIRKYSDPSDPHIEQMLNLYQEGELNSENRIHLDFALAKAYEDIGDYERAFAHLESGNKLRTEQFDYDIESDRALIQSIIQVFTKGVLSDDVPNAEKSDRPIFIVGMPRSGTSLVEKILASHSQVYGAGELDYMFALGTSHFLGPKNDFIFQSLSSDEQNVFAEIGRAYLEKIKLLDSVAAHVTDKMPFNFMMIGIIRLALPNAKIIHCVRDARDTCLSIFKQNFTTGNYRFAYDLRSVAQFHNLYVELMSHWKQVAGDSIYDISYEALTQNPEEEIRKLLAGCNLEFEERCLHFQKTKATVRTASAFQVRQPMYRSSVGLWENYRDFLGPMLEELGH